MYKFAFYLFLQVCTVSALAQISFRGLVKNKESGQPLAGATVKTDGTSTITDAKGLFEIGDVAAGSLSLTISFTGYQTLTTSVSLPDSSTPVFYLKPTAKELENVTVISTTRTNQRIENAPLKVEVLGREEMDEESGIKPGNIASILGDVSGIQIQQSSPVSANSNVRIQGLDGRYTQILRDGMPLFEGFSGGFGILQIPPLDLNQIELVKGSASTLYGGGAIGGLVNLISRRPTMQQHAEILVNQSTLKETDANAYVGKRGSRFGYNFFGGINHQGISDVNKDGFSDVPRLDAVILHPRVFFYPRSSSVAVGYTGTFETRMGGDLKAVAGRADAGHPFFEKNISDRHTLDVQVLTSISPGNRMELKAVGSSFRRTIETNIHYFEGQQRNYFSELAFIHNGAVFNWVAGVNGIGDNFHILPASEPVLLTDFSNQTTGVFSQLTGQLSMQSTLEAGLRYDHHNDYGGFLLPRVAFFHRFSDAWATRLGVGYGYKTPNVLAPQTVEYNIENISPAAPGVKAERSIGYNAEVNFKKDFGDEARLFINHAFFLTQLNDPLVPTELAGGEVVFANRQGSIVSKGFDTYAQLQVDEWQIYAGYTFTVAERNFLSQHKFMPLTPKNRFAFVASFEVEPRWRFALEGSYTGPQYRFNYSRTPAYFFMAAMAAATVANHLTVVLNVENLLDVRQSRYEPLYTGTVTSPLFEPLWAPIDGRVGNVSVKWDFAPVHQK